MASPSSEIRATTSTAVTSPQQAKALSAATLEKLQIIDKQLAAFRNVPKVNPPQDIQANRATQYPLLAEAYQACRSLILAHPVGEPLHPEVATRLIHVLGEHARYRYADETARDKYVVSLQLSFGALAALLYRAGLTESCGDFSKPHMEDCAHLDQEIMTHTPFAFIEQPFRSLDTDVCLQKIVEQQLSTEDIVTISQNLRYLSGTWRGLRHRRPDTKPTPEDNALTLKLLVLAERLLDHSIEHENEPAKLDMLNQEKKSLKYNDGPDLISAKCLPEAEAAAETGKLITWLNERVTFEQEKIWNFNKFSGDTDEANMRQALALGQKFIEHYLSPEEQDAFRKILKGNIDDYQLIQKMAKLLVGKVKMDPGFELDLARYTMIPKNLAEVLLNVKSPNKEEIVALYRFAAALSHIYMEGLYHHVVPYWSFNESLKSLTKLATDLNDECERLAKLTSDAFPADYLSGSLSPSTPQLAAKALEGLYEKIMQMNEPELSTKAAEIDRIDFSRVLSQLDQAQTKADEALGLLLPFDGFVFPEKLPAQTKEKLKPAVTAVADRAASIRKLIKDITATKANLKTLERAKEAFSKRKQEIAAK